MPRRNCDGAYFLFPPRNVQTAISYYRTKSYKPKVSIIMEEKIPYKIYLKEEEIPSQWYNVRADMKNKPAPLLNPGTLQPMTQDELSHVFCEELCRQELDNDTRWFDIPQEIRDFYKMYRPSPLVRAYFLEKALGTPAKIYYKFEIGRAHV